MTPARVFVGRDPKEAQAYHVCVESMAAHSTRALHVEPLIAPMLSRAGLYRREYDTIDGQRVDQGDGRPFSTEFTFTRFLVPALCQWQRVALFCDSDFLWRDDVARLFDEADPRYAVQVVKRAFEPDRANKMRGQVQQSYPRKLWSSLVLWNCSHPANKALTPDVVSRRTGRWLHGFGWLPEDAIGELSSGWNHLADIDDAPEPRAVHYTNGTPDMAGYEGAEYAHEWRAY